VGIEAKRSAEDFARISRSQAEAMLRDAQMKAAAEVEKARRAAEDAGAKAESIANSAKLAAEEAMNKAQEALVKAVIKRLTSWEWISILVIINLSIVFAAVLLATAFGALI